ncbi:DUF1810 domain-containing protein [Microvirga terricola]|uniref:DUF1810 domain-containing protein n=1 Tax=Microvirga terricola TaxID=2719797 RepID=A0ABX0VGM9_9HYPH|nr:DUF1810 domain-containing protein [Microvirga terricola]NIX77955.1 DUF1810 domain-containing protein [Microvirga terricola]
MATQKFDLDRFVRAQAPVYGRVVAELEEGLKRTHWMWFVFPQIEGLGHSPMAQKYAIGSLDEARAYLDHPVLGPRLVACTDLVMRCDGIPLHTIFGSPDDRKFHSSMTLFALASPGQSAFHSALDRYFEGRMDPRTLSILNMEPGA